MTIAEALRKEMISRGVGQAWSGDPDLCLSAYALTNGQVKHPLNRIKAVLDGARRSPLFEQRGYVLASDASGNREVQHPLFVLKQTNP